MNNLNCPICGEELHEKRTDLPEYMIPEYDEAAAISEEMAREFEIDNTEEILWCPYCGRIE